MGSGTTLLRLVLDSHEHIAIPQETGFMRAYNAHQFIPFKWSGRNWAKRMGWSRAELDAELAAFYDRIFMRHVERQGKRRWGDKTPLHTFHVADMARLFPESVFVAIVRHPAGGVASNVSRWNQTLDEATYHYLRYTKEIVRQAARRRRRFVVLRYEDLVLQPERTLRELLDWLGEPWSDSVLAHHTVQPARGGRTKVEGRNRIDDPIDVARIAKWTRTLDAPAQREVARRLGRIGAFFGYDMEDPAVLGRLGRRGSPLMGGRQVNRRIDRFGDLDLRTPVPVPAHELLYDPRELELVHRRSADASTLSALRDAVGPLSQRLPPNARWRLLAARERLTGRGDGGPRRG
jgi:hypothetical protein